SAVRSATGFRCLPLMLLFMTLGRLSNGHCLASFALNVVSH
ncbi:hypothetical protein TNCT_282671, partial [Trichonephila clavata]